MRQGSALLIYRGGFQSEAREPTPCSGEGPGESYMRESLVEKQVGRSETRKRGREGGDEEGKRSEREKVNERECLKRE